MVCSLARRAIFASAVSSRLDSSWHSENTSGRVTSRVGRISRSGVYRFWVSDTWDCSSWNYSACRVMEASS
jgi:hypothetical protein